MREKMLLGPAIVLAATILGLFFYHSRASENTVRVVGAATQRFESDIIKWRLTVSRSVAPGNLASGYAGIAEDLNLLTGELQAHGVAAKDLNIQPVSAYPTTNPSGVVTGYSIVQSLFLVSGDVVGLEALALNPAGLLKRGIVLQGSSLEYHSSKLSDLKRVLLAEATRDARRRAEEIASSAGLSVGPLVSARAGVFQINEPYSTDVSDYGIFNASSRQKDITVTVNAVFEMQ